jgi:hypothetical protein
MSDNEPEGRDPQSIAGEIQEREWLDVPEAPAAPPEGDLPDDFATRLRKPGLWDRIRSALTHG